MKIFDLKPPRLWYQKIYTTHSDKESNLKYDFANLLKEIKLSDQDINQVWSCDLSYLKFKQRYYYLSIVKDIVSGAVVGFGLSISHNAQLTIESLHQALGKSGNQPALIVHFDQGTENLNQSTISFLQAHQLKISVSNKGSPWQNGWAESFFSRFKAEVGNLNRFDDEGEVIAYIYEYINYYNKNRIQLRLKMSPYQFIKRHKPNHPLLKTL